MTLFDCLQLKMKMTQENQKLYSEALFVLMNCEHWYPTIARKWMPRRKANEICNHLEEKYYEKN